MRLIDADALIKSIKNTADLGGWIGAAVYHIKQVAIKYIDDAPSIDIEPKRGKWVEDGGIEKCNQCGERKEFPHWNFCPNCGADMRKGADDEVR